MLLTVILLSSAILGSATIVGILMTYEIRYSRDVISSAQAVFAADAGIECASYNFYKDPDINCGTEASPITMSNAATFWVDVYLDELGINTIVNSFGRSRQTARAFELTL